ncbi:MAG: SRPBCC domain-containing protein [Sphingobacteriales bacterium]|nr:MAG: SRPBCC domain-containing protein [Sphingobacteriales bacterium]
MASKSFHATIKVNTSAEEAIKKINEVNKWWAKKVKGKSEKLNDQFTVDFGTTWVDFQITELVPNKKVVWKVTDCNLGWIKNKKEWNDTAVVFEISEKKNATQIDFTHAGLIPSFECYEDCKTGWTEHVTESLVMFINDGKGMPQ